MGRFKQIIAIFLLLILASCTPALEETKKLESGAGQGIGGSSCQGVSDMLQVPPENPMKRDLTLGSGSVVHKGPVDFILTFIEEKLDSATENLFEELNSGGAIDTLIIYSFALWIAMFTASFLMGLVRMSQYEVVMMIIKVMFVLALATDYAFFVQLIKDPIENGGKELAEIMAGIFSNNVQDIRFMDDVVSTLLSFNSLKLVYTLFSPELGAGWLYGILYLFFIYYFVTALLKTVYLIVLAMLVRAFLLGLAPIYLGLIIFKQTRTHFDGWLKQVVNFTIMPVILYTFMGFFYAMIQFHLLELGETPMGQTAKDVCYGQGYTMPGNFTDWVSLMFGAPGEEVYGLDADLPINLTPLLSLLIISYVLRQMVDWAAGLSGSITQAFTTFRPSAAPPQLVQQLKNVTSGGGKGSGGGGAGAGLGDKRTAIGQG